MIKLKEDVCVKYCPQDGGIFLVPMSDKDIREYCPDCGHYLIIKKDCD